MNGRKEASFRTAAAVALRPFCRRYESCTTRLFHDGRTETIRTLTAQSVAFVRGVHDEAMSNAQRLNLLREATRQHRKNTILAMSGEGMDRHLFALYVVSKSIGQCEGAL